MTTISPRLLAARVRRLRRRGKAGTPLQPTHFEVWRWDKRISNAGIQYVKPVRYTGLSENALSARQHVDRMQQSALAVGSSVFKAMKRFFSRGRGN